MTHVDKKNIDLFLAFCELQDGDLEPVDRGLLDRFSEFSHRFNDIEESSEPELVKTQQFNEWDRWNKPFFESLNERVSYLCSPAFLNQDPLLN